MHLKWRYIFHVDHLIVAAFTILIIKLLVLVAVNLDFLSPVVRAVNSFSMTDIYYKIQNASQKDTCRTVTLVDMTELRHRADIARLVEELGAMEPTVMGFDIIFEGLMEDDEADAMLAEAFASIADRSVVACELTDYDAGRQAYQSAVRSYFAEDCGLREGFINVLSDPSKSIASYTVTLPLGDSLVQSFPAQLATLLTGSEVTAEAEHTIQYKPIVFPVVKWNELQNHRDLIDNHVVLVGTTQEAKDKHYTPIGQTSGLEIIGHTLLSMTESGPTRHASHWMVILWALIAGYLTNLIDFLLTKTIEHRRSTLMIFITQSEFYDKFISFIVMVLVTWASFELYVTQNYFVNTVLALSTIVLIEEGRLLYAGILAVLRKKTDWKLLAKSLYAEDT